MFLHEKKTLDLISLKNINSLLWHTHSPSARILSLPFILYYSCPAVFGCCPCSLMQSWRLNVSKSSAKKKKPKKNLPARWWYYDNSLFIWPFAFEFLYYICRIVIYFFLESLTHYTEHNDLPILSKIIARGICTSVTHNEQVLIWAKTLNCINHFNLISPSIICPSSGSNLINTKLYH